MTREIYHTKYPLKQVLISMFVLLGILTYIFWGVLHFVAIIGIMFLAILLISITLIPIFILREDALVRTYNLRPFNKIYIYQLRDIEKIEIKQDRQGSKAFPTMKIFFTENGKAKNHFFHFIKDTQEDFNRLTQKMRETGITVELLSGN